MFTISIGKADTKCPDKVTLTSGMVNAVQVSFAFSEEWEGFDKIAVFSNGDTTIDVTLDEGKCYIPHEILSKPGKEVTCGVYGSKGEGEDYVAIPTEKCSLGKVTEGVNPSGDESAEPTPTIWDELNIRVENLENKSSGDAGYEYKDVSVVDLPQTWSGDNWGNIDGNVVTVPTGYVDIEYSGYADIVFTIKDGDAGFNVNIQVDDTDICNETSVTGKTYSYKGDISRGIKIVGDLVMVEFTRFTELITTDGLMKGADKLKLDELSETVGDFDKALDELHAYAQSVISGGETE